MADTLEALDNEQILKSAKQRKEQLSIEDLRSILAATSSRQTAETSKAQPVNTAAVQTDAAPQASNSTKSAVLTECCATGDVPARLRYSQGSFPNSCPVSGKPFAQDAAVGRAVSQQQQIQLMLEQQNQPGHAQNSAEGISECPSASAQQLATAATLIELSEAAAPVQILAQLQHTGRDPGSKESREDLPTNEAFSRGLA